MARILLDIVLIAVGLGFAGFAALMIYGIADTSYRWFARVHRIYKSAKHQFDSDGIRQHSVPEDFAERFPWVFNTYLYYVSSPTSYVMLVDHRLGVALNSTEPIYCVAYNGRADQVYVAKRISGVAPRMSRGLRKKIARLDLDEYLEPLRFLDRHHNPGRYAATSISIGTATPDERDRTRFTCKECGALLVGMSALNQHRDTAHTATV